MQYGALLSRAWNILWRNKVIWFFGFLAALGGSGSRFQCNSNMPSSGQPGGGGLPPEWEQVFTRLFSDKTLLITIVVALILIWIAIALILALVSALGHGAMVEMAREADETGTTRFRTGWRTGLRRMLPVFVVRLLVGLPASIIMVAGAIPLVLTSISLASQPYSRGSSDMIVSALLGSFACFFLAMCIGVLLMIPLGVLGILSVRALVLEDRGVLGSIRRGWGIFTGNLGEIAVLWLIFLLMGLVVAIVIGLPMAAMALIMFVPLAFMAMASPIFLILVLLAGILFGLASAAVNGVIEAYTSTVWTLAYRQFAAQPSPALEMA